MSLGTKVYTVRLSDELMDRVNATLERRKKSGIHVEMSLSDFIRAALVDKMNHLDRSRMKSKYRRPAKEEDEQDFPVTMQI